MNAALHVEASGRGPTLVMLHGWASNLRVFDALAASLEGRYRVVRIDLPGHGRSDAPGGGDGRALDRLANQLLETVDGPATWLGWSLGGLLALRIAGLASDAVTGLVLVSSTPRFVATDDWPHGIDGSVLEDFAAQLGRDPPATVRDFLELQLRGSAGAAASLAQLRGALDAHGEAQPAGLRHGLELLRSTDLRAGLGAVRCPTLVLAGQRDRITPPGASAALAAALPAAEHHEFARAAHAPFLSHPEQFVARLESWRAGR